MQTQNYYVYILSNKYNAVFYVGVTNDLVRRITEHKEKINSGFTSKYNCTKLIWYEVHTDINYAIKKEKQLKRWKRSYKFSLITKMNPNWVDLYESIL